MAQSKKHVELTPAEEALLDEWLWFYQELASGTRAPTTSAQERFVQVSRGHAVAESEHELAYAKWMRIHAGDNRTAQPSDEVGFDDRLPRSGWFTDEDWRKLRSRRG